MSNDNTHQTPVSIALDSSLAGYLAATALLSIPAASSLQAQVVTGFQDPYSLPGNLALSGEGSMTGPIGDWNGAFGGTGATAAVSLTTENATPPTSLNFNFSSTTTFGVRGYDLTTTSAGNGNVDFTISGVSAAGSVKNAEFMRNGISQGSILANNIYSFAVTLGQTFGFRFTVGYNAPPPGSLGLTISGFSAPVPEPAATGLWMGAGALGMVAIREFRRRTQKRASGV